MHKSVLATAVFVVAAAILAGVATGGAATQQRIAFGYTNGNPDKMSLTPLTSGPVLAIPEPRPGAVGPRRSSSWTASSLTSTTRSRHSSASAARSYGAS